MTVIKSILTIKLFFLQETQIAELEKAGFKKENISTETMPITPDPDCRYYEYNQMIAPTIIKQ